MKILILGGTKFFGREFAAQAAAGGDSVTVFSRRCPVQTLPASVRQICGRREDQTALAAIADEKWDVVVDNICFTAEDAETASKAFSGKTGLYIFVSSSWVNICLEGARSPYTEESADIFPQDATVIESGREAYGAGKRAAEKVFLAAGRSLPVAILRFPAIIGPNDPKMRAYSYWLRIKDGAPLILPEDASYFYRRYLYSGDAARAILLAAAHPRECAGQIFNFGDDAIITLREFLEISAGLMGTKLNAAVIPSGWLAEHGYSFSSSPYYRPFDFVLSTVKAQTVLGWRSGWHRTWLKDTIDWYFGTYSGPRPPDYSGRDAELELIRQWETENGKHH